MLVHHPDVNGGDDTQAKAVLEAYGALRNRTGLRDSSEPGAAPRVTLRPRRGFYEDMETQAAELEPNLWPQYDTPCASEEECAAYASACEAALRDVAARREERAAKRTAFTQGADADAAEVARVGQRMLVFLMTTLLAGEVLSQRMVVEEVSAAQRAACYERGGGLCRFL